MTDADIWVLLTEIMSDLLGTDELVLTPATTADDVEGWDSFSHLNLIAAIEARFGIQTQTKEIEKLRNVGDLMALIKRHVA